MQSTIHIPQPCAEDWEAMTPVDRGRHCAQCCKTVVDFTGWTVNDIGAYLQVNAGSRVCGRFTEDQLQQDYFVPETYLYNVFSSGLHYLKQIAAIIVFVFVLTGSVSAQVHRQDNANSRAISKGDVDVRAQEPPKLAGAPVAIVQSTAHVDSSQLNRPAKPVCKPTVKGKVMISPSHKKK